MDRILEDFSRRYWDCNPGSLFGNPGGVLFHIVALTPTDDVSQVLSMQWLTRFFF